jgi:chemotaxis protein MotA
MRAPVYKLSILGAAIVTLTAAFGSPESLPFQSYIDVKAALLVFVMPLLVLAFYQKDPVPLGTLWRRFRELKRASTSEVVNELLDLTASSPTGASSAKVAQFGEQHQDEFVRYCADLYVSKFTTSQLEELLSNRIEAEETRWSNLYMALGFLAKMAPYFGMLATVLGMTDLLRHMDDYHKISGSMALALQGTLYGLLSFTVLYSPLQKAVMGVRDSFRQRNLLVARWFLLVSDKAEPALVRQQLLSHLPAGVSSTAVRSESNS